MELLRVCVGVVLEEDLTRTDGNVSALPIQREDTPPLDFKRRIAERAVVAIGEERKVRY